MDPKGLKGVGKRRAWRHTFDVPDAMVEAVAETAHREVVGRLAPSPTGNLHLGHAFSMLLAYFYARRVAGRVVLRIDDVDVERADPKFVEQIIEDLRWLGIEWDGPPVLSSDRGEQQRAAIRQLVSQGAVYPCVCSRGDVLRALGAPQQGKGEIRYPGTCRGRFDSLDQAQAETGRKPCLRMIAPHDKASVEDGVFGRFEQDLAAEVGDFVVVRQGGAPAYQLSVVVDDACDGVTQVVRGRDLLPSTLRQNTISRALGWQIPDYFHVPLICDHQGRRLAKRHDDLSLARLRELGVSPSRVSSWVARCAGQTPEGGLDTARAIAERFDPQRLVPGDIVLSADPTQSLHPNWPIVRT